MNEFETYFILGLIIVIAFVFICLYAVWCFISSAIKSGVIQAVEYLEERDNIKENETQLSKTLDNSFEKDLNGWVSFKK